MLGFAPIAATPLATAGSGVSIVVLLTGVAATGQVGVVSVTGSAVAPSMGLFATGQLGAVTVDISNNTVAILIGVQATADVGTVLAIPGVDVSTTGVSANGQVGQLQVAAGAGAQVIGVFGTGFVGSALVWGQLLLPDGSVWTPVSPDAINIWQNITT